MAAQPMDQSKVIQSEFDTAARVLETMRADPTFSDRVSQSAELCARAVRGGGKILAVGNGGSCADAVHFCEELTGRYRESRDPIPAIACADAGHLTCTANDFGYDAVFERWVQALARPDDAVIALSTSGNSANILRAVNAAHERGASTVTLLGKGGGKLAGVGTIEFIVPGETADRIQELHMLILHALVGGIERALA
ncbi:MAG: D-sedoheptulose 7-phosphate isomerase [Phycisphaerales bacterium]|jgi:D-sedoheptulose 7-phosphate isomerase